MVTPSEFLVQHNPGIGTSLIKAGYTPGRLAIKDNCPTLAHVAAVYGEAAAIAWLNIQLDSVDNVQGNAAFGESARRDAAHLIYARYKNIAVVSLLLFFTQYKLGEFVAETKGIGGVQKVIVALKYYIVKAEAEANKLIHEEEIEKAFQERLKWGRNKPSEIR